MTPVQRKQWNLYACVPRCVILGFKGPDFVLFNPTQDGQAFRMIETLPSLTEQEAEFVVLH